MSMNSMNKYRLAVDENGSPFVLNSKGSIDFGYITEEMNLPKEGDYWKVISGGVFRIRYSKNKRIIHSASEVRTSSPVEDELLPLKDK